MGKAQNTLPTLMLTLGMCKPSYRTLALFEQQSDFPYWLGNYYSRPSHRSNLVRKFPEHYGAYLWSEDASSPYLWPVQ